MRRTLGLQTWLALALAAGIALPLLLGAGAWLIADRWQVARENDRVVAATNAIAGTHFDDPAAVEQLLTRLKSLNIAADLGGLSTSTPVTKAGDGPISPADAKAVLPQDYRQVGVVTGNAKAVLFIPRRSATVRWLAALGAGVAALLLVVAAAIAGLRRWVMRPLQELADGADRIAGGDLTLAPVATRAREIDQVATAMGGMTGELGHALEASDAAERERRFVVTAIAHDLRTPLFTLRGSLQAIERGIGNGEYLALAQRKADHVDRLVSDLFALSRLEYAPAPLGSDAVDVGALAREAASHHEVVTVDVAGDATLTGDAEGLLRVLTNLVDNAVRHATSAVRVDVRADPRTVMVVVSDDGPGIPPELLDRVFEPLVTGDGARGGGGGAGLGLAIVDRIVAAHGGTVGAANDGGAVVAVTLPRLAGT